MYSYVSDSYKQSPSVPLSKANTFTRSTRILSEFIGLEFSIYNGKTFTSLKISSSMVGFSFGDFVFTKKTGSKIHTSTKTVKKVKRA